MEREVVARRTMIDARMLAAVSAARGGRAPVGSHVAAWVRNAVGFNDDNLPRRRVMGVHRRTVHNTLVGAGVVADGRQRWAVERIVEWRGGCRNREALVQWGGFDPRTGDRWRQEWVPRDWLTRDLRELGRLRAPPPKRAQHTRWPIGSRKSPRLAGAEPMDGL